MREVSNVTDKFGNRIKRFEDEAQIRLEITVAGKPGERLQEIGEAVEKWYWKHVGINREKKTVLGTNFKEL